jgi:2-oxoglutarate ferredoxin oxidoreductase subunit delta
MANVKIKSEKCKGCGLCVHYCPVKHLDLSSDLNKKGVRYAFIKPTQANVCLGCGFCFHICPDACVEISIEPIEKKPEIRTK